MQHSYMMCSVKGNNLKIVLRHVTVQYEEDCIIFSVGMMKLEPFNKHF